MVRLGFSVLKLERSQASIVLQTIGVLKGVSRKRSVKNSTGLGTGRV